MELSRRKRKGSETQGDCSNLPVILPSNRKLPSIGSHLSLEDCLRLNKRCKEQAAMEAVGSNKSRFTGIVTAPPCGSSSLHPLGRGIKRKIGCIDAATQLGRKKKIEEEYLLGATLGRGRFGWVRLCRSRASGAEFACKTLLKEGKECVHQEVEIMQHLSGHPGVVTLKSVYEDSDCFHLVMELCSGGRLLGQMVKGSQYSEHRAANLLKELILVIKYCHDMGVVHRDIKPENILLTTSGKLKLADFGLAVRVSNGRRLSGVAGSRDYVAPEVLLGDYSEKVDIWGAGVLLHALLVGTVPFQGDSAAVYEAIKKVKLDFHGGVWELISEPARDLISRMLTRDVSARMTADQVLRHPWILSNMEEETLKTLSIKSKVRNHVGAWSRQLNVVPRVESERNRMTDGFLSDDPGLVMSFDRLDQKDQDNCGLVDAQAVAISRVRISETRRSWLCGPPIPLLLTVVPRVESERKRMADCSLSDDSGLVTSFDRLDQKDQDECDLVDALAVAISRVRISEPKRSRLCGPPIPIQQECSSNMKANNLCTAF